MTMNVAEPNILPNTPPNTPHVGGNQPFDPEVARRDFPIFDQQINGRPLVFLDTAASAQKPRQVIDAVTRLYEQDYANVHRGVYELARRATDAYEAARLRAASFLNAAKPHEIILLRGTTEAINLVAQTHGRANLGAGDEIVLSELEHHSNIVPWQMVAEATGARIRVAPVDDRGAFLLDRFGALLNERTKIVAVTHVSNAFGTITPLAEIIAMAHDAGAAVVVDGAQAAPHMPVDVQALDADFYAFSGHKVYGPSGIGVLYGKEALLEAMPPYQGGGEMIRTVTFEKTTYGDLPHKFEAGTPNIAGAAGLTAALDYVSELGFAALGAHEQHLLAYATGRLNDLDGVQVLGTAPEKSGVLSLLMDGAHPHDIGTILDHQGIAIRGGHHCAQPLMDRFGVAGTARASLGLYNTTADIDALIEGLKRVKDIFG